MGVYWDGENVVVRVATHHSHTLTQLLMRRYLYCSPYYLSNLNDLPTTESVKSHSPILAFGASDKKAWKYHDYNKPNGSHFTRCGLSTYTTSSAGVRPFVLSTSHRFEPPESQCTEGLRCSGPSSPAVSPFLTRRIPRCEGVPKW